MGSKVKQDSGLSAPKSFSFVQTMTIANFPTSVILMTVLQDGISPTFLSVMEPDPHLLILEPENFYGSPHLCLRTLPGALFYWRACFLLAHLLLGAPAFASRLLAQSLPSAGTGRPIPNFA